MSATSNFYAGDMRIYQRLLAGATVGLIALTGCAAEPVTPDAEAEPVAVETASPEAIEVPTLPGYDVGDFPAVPLFVLPDLAMVNDSLAGFAIDISDQIGDYPGLRVEPLHCDASGDIVYSSPNATLYGDGSGTYREGANQVVIDGDGSGVLTDGSRTVIVDGDGSGVYEDGALRVVINGDGSGAYSDGLLRIVLNGDGSGTFDDGAIETINNGDGSGAHTNGSVRIVNNGDGSGTYSDGATRIVNNGDGSGTITIGSVSITLDGNGAGTYTSGATNDVIESGWARMTPLVPVPLLGDFPNMESIQPVESCGARIVLEDGVLFDFDKSTIRPDAADILDTVATALTDLTMSSGVIAGHTDAIGSDAYNQDLSARRAQSVFDALRARGVSGALDIQGFGESQPVAANEIDGADNPAGRALNRRVEILIPSIGA